MLVLFLSGLIKVLPLREVFVIIVLLVEFEFVLLIKGRTHLYFGSEDDLNFDAVAEIFVLPFDSNFIGVFLK